MKNRYLQQNANRIKQSKGQWFPDNTTSRLTQFKKAMQLDDRMLAAGGITKKAWKLRRESYQRQIAELEKK